MPPEALRNPPEYSSKLDSFSFGVLMLQILTRRFPKPGPAGKSLRRAGPGGGDVIIPVKEVTRRGADIALIDRNHPILQLALHCLEDDEDFRPMPDELCDRFTELKDLPDYAESKLVARAPSEVPAMMHDHAQYRQRVFELEEQLKALQVAVNAQDSELMQMRFTLEKKEAEIGMLKGGGAGLSRGPSSSSYGSQGYPSSRPSSSCPPQDTSRTNPGYAASQTPQPHPSSSNPPALPTYQPPQTHPSSSNRPTPPFYDSPPYQPPQPCPLTFNPMATPHLTINFNLDLWPLPPSLMPSPGLWPTCGMPASVCWSACLVARRPCSTTLPSLTAKG